MSPSKSTNDRSCDGSQDRKVDRLKARLLDWQGGTTVAKVPAERLGGAIGPSADWIRTGGGGGGG